MKEWGMERLEIVFDFATPSQNKLKSWRAMIGWNKKFDKYLKNYCLVKKYRAGEKREISITRHSKRTLDFGNLVGGCKPLLDALKRAGLIVDDSPEWIKDGYTQEIGKPKTEVVIQWDSQNL
jgi:hypothetical protein